MKYLLLEIRQYILFSLVYMCRNLNKWLYQGVRGQILLGGENKILPVMGLESELFVQPVMIA